MQGNTGKIGLALMNDTTTLPAAPAITLRAKQYADPMPQYTETEEDVATGTRFGRQKFIQGVQAGNKTIVAAATLRDLPLLLQALLGAPDGTGLITPRPTDYGALMPGQPVAVWQAHPLMDSLFPAAQIGGLTINIPNRNNAEVSVTLNTARVNELTPPLPAFPPLVSTGVMQMLHWYLKIDDVVYKPESGSIVIEQGMEAEDGAQGLDDAGKMYVLGWSANGPLTARVEFQLSEAGAGSAAALRALLAAARPNAATGERVQKEVETGFKIGDKDVKFTFPTAQLIANNIPNGLGRLVVGMQAEGVGLGVPPVLVNVPVPAA
ncbi:hypothetical protein L1280_002785 [Deinococcus sp. HSC-46F16]|uniref:hypothetical protein n=1 Tax=Deinococcus sp. HSC-46F16 TaxID=2910968 RepID=UPI00209DF6E3|nr:hypothetical protein [Deinococcus sp. HSC-46F16]MCP2015617.1 hypothetical protein [Deinococcus sp. HSC-46F16]